MTKPFIRIFFAFATGLLIISSVFSICLYHQYQPYLASCLLSGTFIFGAVSFILVNARLITQIRTDGIYLRFPPLQNRITKFTWESIGSIHIRTYNPTREFGGWGICFGPNGTAYNIAGNIGIQIVFTNGNKMLIGTNDPENLSIVLNRIGGSTFHLHWQQ